MSAHDLTPPTLTTLHLTDQERITAARALHMCAAFMDALDDPLSAGAALELSERICPEGFTA